MKRSKLLLRKVLVLSLILSIPLAVFNSCDRDENKNTNTGMFPTPEYPSPDDADVVLVAVNATAPSPMPSNSLVDLGPFGDDVFNVEIGMGVAVFKNKGKADKVLLNGKELKYTNGVYTWLPDFSSFLDPSDAFGIDLSGNITWEITNPNINKTLNRLPSTPKITSSKEITRSSGYNLTHSRVSGAEKILYVIASEKGDPILKEKVGSSTSCEFTAEELSKLSKSEHAMVQANAYTITNETIGGKKVYFVRQSSFSVMNVNLK